MIPSPLETALDIKRALAAAGMPLAASPVDASTTLASLRHALSDLWHRSVLSLRRWQLRRTTFNALHDLDRRTLSDLGIDRCELWSIADSIADGGDATRVPRMCWTRELPY